MSNLLPSGFQIQIASDVDYEFVYAEINFHGRYVCSVVQEKGTEALEIEIHSDVRLSPEPRIVPLDDFVVVLAAAKSRLIGRSSSA